MTDKEIEKGLRDLSSIDLTFEANYDSCGRLVPPRGMIVIQQALKYINRLKANIKILQSLNDRLCIEAEYRGNEEKEQVRKETAKEILQWVNSEMTEGWGSERWAEITKGELRDKAEAYGVEVYE